MNGLEPGTLVSRQSADETQYGIVEDPGEHKLAEGEELLGEGQVLVLQLPHRKLSRWELHTANIEADKATAASIVGAIVQKGVPVQPPAVVQQREASLFELVALDVGRMVAEKNKAYGDSVGSAGEAFRLLYPDGVRPDQLDDALMLVRVWDKMSRIANKKGAFGESPWRDIMGYALLSLEREERWKRAHRGG